MVAMSATLGAINYLGRCLSERKFLQLPVRLRGEPATEASPSSSSDSINYYDLNLVLIPYPLGAASTAHCES